MIKILKPIIVATTSLAMLFTTSIFSTASSQTAETTPHNLLVLGDSISSGYGLDNYQQGREFTRNYANILAEQYDITDKLTNLAIDGQTSAELLEKLKKGEYDELLSSADCVITSIGGNDILHFCVTAICDALGISSFEELGSVDFTNISTILTAVSYFASDEATAELDSRVVAFEANFVELTTLMREKAPNANLIFLTVYDPFTGNDTYKTFDQVASPILESINDVVRNNTMLTDSTAIYKCGDLYAGFGDMGYDLTNIAFFDIHPNSGGHEKIAEICDTLVREWDYTPKQATKELSGVRKKAVVTVAVLGGIMLVLVAIFVFRRLSYVKPPKKQK